ncbi:MAG: hypothetical protein UIJ87_03130 [Anaerovoracaceae bacterium]|nr:hypothetical protein [Anaerovoracaceae bacterium]
MAMNQVNTTWIERDNMTPVMENAAYRSNSTSSYDDDIPVSEINIEEITAGSNGNQGYPESYPQIIPDSPTFTVPANPLLPDKYNEILDYNLVQYLNGIFRTQIGRFVRIQQLIGSNITQDFDGFLIGVGINYIILQEYANQDIRILDIYGIKQMYVHYSEPVPPFTGI